MSDDSGTEKNNKPFILRQNKVNVSRLKSQVKC